MPVIVVLVVRLRILVVTFSNNHLTFQAGSPPHRAGRFVLPRLCACDNVA
jgi:hypothetical protein